MTHLLLFLVLASGPGQDKVQIVAHPKTPVTSISQQELRLIFFGKKKAWSNGSRVLPITIKRKELHTSFLQNCLNKSRRQFTNFWKRMIFTGKGIPPKAVGSEEELLAYVAANPGAIGYISGQTQAAGLKTLRLE